jgi:protein tyrosine phosphatase type 4A
LIEAGMANLEAVEFIRSRRRGALNMKQIHFLDSYKRRGKGKLAGLSGDVGSSSNLAGDKDKDKCCIM